MITLSAKNNDEILTIILVLDIIKKKFEKINFRNYTKLFYVVI